MEGKCEGEKFPMTTWERLKDLWFSPLPVRINKNWVTPTWYLTIRGMYVFGGGSRMNKTWCSNRPRVNHILNGFNVTWASYLHGGCRYVMYDLLFSVPKVYFELCSLLNEKQPRWMIFEAPFLETQSLSHLENTWGEFFQLMLRSARVGWRPRKSFLRSCLRASINKDEKRISELKKQARGFFVQICAF